MYLLKQNILSINFFDLYNSTQRVRRLDGITDLMGMSLSKLQEFVMDREAWHAAIHRVTKSWTRLRDWTELTRDKFKPYLFLQLYAFSLPLYPTH